jgi:lipoyl(octanoyl) transferase
VIEEGLMTVCREFGIDTQQISGRSGVWVRDERGDRKIAAIGIRVAQGVSMHGFALNVNPELAAFNRIIPCGINDAAVTSMADELSRDISVNEVIPVVEKYLLESLMKVSA